MRLTTCVVWLVCAQASAQDLTPQGVAEGDAAEIENERPLEWQPWAATVPLVGLTLGIELGLDPSSARWASRGLVDRSFEPWIRDTPDGLHAADLASDVLMYSLIAAPVADIALWQATEHQERRDAYRLFSAAALAFSMQSLLVSGTKNIVRRARPYVRNCRDDPEASGCNSSSRYRGFISGHTSVAFTGASLLCAFARLRGQRAAGRAECLLGLLAATMTGALRIVGEQHYFSDVLAGAVSGFLSGFIIPVFAYPRYLSESPRPSFPPSAPTRGHGSSLGRD